MDKSRMQPMPQSTDLKPADQKALLKLLRRLLTGPASLAPEVAGKVTLECGGAPWPSHLLDRAVREGLVQQKGDQVCATAETAGYVRRAMLAGEDAFADQHRMEAQETVEVEGSRQHVRRNLAESPLSLLARLKDRSGSAFLPTEAIDAGERLLSDFTRAQLQPRVTASWEPRLSGRGRGDRGGQADIADTAIAARERFSRAVDAMGPELAGVAVDVCCFSKGLEVVERERQWPVRSAKLMLRTALLALARHYAPPPRAERRSHRWGGEGYRPPMPR